MTSLDPRRVLLATAAPLLAVVVALLLSGLLLLATGAPVLGTFATMLEYGSRPRSIVNTLNTAVTLYLSALAVAIGFKMGLFNIGVDGQYRMAAVVSAIVGGAVVLPGPLHVLLIVVVAMGTGALWAGIAAVLKVTRGVSEVISTIMLNFIAISLSAYLLRRFGTLAGNDISTTEIAPSGRVPGLPLVPGAGTDVLGFLVVAVVAGVAYSVLVNRTRFGFDLRTAGASQSAAVASGVDVRRMVVTAMLLSGAVAGLVGLPILLGQAYSYGLTFPTGLGFAGIAIALLGRNHPVGIAIGALLFAYLQSSAQILALEGISPEIVTIMQGIIVLAVVVAYELVRRYRVGQEQRRVARELERGTSGPDRGTSIEGARS